MKVGSVFLIRTFTLFAWASFFLWLLATGEVHRYIGSRTYWVVIFGAVALTVAAFAHLLGGDRMPDGPMVRVKDAVGLIAMLLPILILFFVPKPSLGALAASKKSTGGVVSTIGRLQPPDREPGGELSLEEIEYASQSSEYAQAVGIVEGASMKLIGFVTHPKNAEEGTFSLTRFQIFCCAADAVPYSARVVPPPGTPDYPDDKWLEIKGTLAKDDKGFFVEATEIKPISEPSSPYI